MFQIDKLISFQMAPDRSADYNGDSKKETEAHGNATFSHQGRIEVRQPSIILVLEIPPYNPLTKSISLVANTL